MPMTADSRSDAVDGFLDGPAPGLDVSCSNRGLFDVSIGVESNTSGLPTSLKESALTTSRSRLWPVEPISDSSKTDELSRTISFRNGLLGSVDRAETLDVELTGAPKTALTLATGAVRDGRHEEVLLGAREEEERRPFNDGALLIRAGYW